MHDYLKWEEKTTTDLSDENINKLYNEGFVFTRKNKGVMNQTRSVRIDLDKFELSSENRRIIKKTEGLNLEIKSIPYSDYSWQIGKLGKDFYETKFGKNTFSANKIKELLTNEEKSNFNKLFTYTAVIPTEMNEANEVEESLGITKRDPSTPLRCARDNNEGSTKQIGYCVCKETHDILHYSYPFYKLDTNNPNTGMGMMTRAVIWAKENNKKYIYLGSASSTKSLYKFQFKGIEWFDEKNWTNNIKKIKEILK